MLILLIRKRAKKVLEHGFFKLAIYKNEHNAKKLVARYMSAILKFKNRATQASVWGKLKTNNLRNKALVNFVKLLRGLENNYKRATFLRLRLCPPNTENKS